jgi:TolB protein
MASSPDFSADGKSIAFSSRSPETGMPNLYVASVDGSKRINITNSKSIDTAPSWSPTSRQIVFTSDRSGDNQLYSIDADGTNLRQITFEEGLKDSPDWSPDGRYIVFTWRPKQQPYFDLYLIDLMTNRTYQLTSNARNNENPSWAPDGRHIAFQSNRDGSDQIYVMVSDGTSVKKLTNGGVSNEAPAWGNYPPR